MIGRLDLRRKLLGAIMYDSEDDWRFHGDGAGCYGCLMALVAAIIVWAIVAYTVSLFL